MRGGRKPGQSTLPLTVHQARVLASPGESGLVLLDLRKSTKSG